MFSALCKDGLKAMSSWETRGYNKMFKKEEEDNAKISFFSFQYTGKSLASHLNLKFFVIGKGCNAVCLSIKYEGRERIWQMFDFRKGMNSCT